MRRTSPSTNGFTLIELVVTIVLTAIIMGALVFFVYPLRQAVDVTARADLTEAADSALRRVGRDVRLALPNSVRVATDASGRAYLEYLAVRTAGRYRADGQGAGGGSLANCASNDASRELTSSTDSSSFSSAALTPLWILSAVSAAADLMVLSLLMIVLS